MDIYQEYEQIVRRLRKQFVLELLRFKTLYWTTTEEINDYYHLNYSDNAMTIIVVKCYARDGNYNDVASVMTLVEQYMYDYLRPWFHELETAHDNLYVIGVYDIISTPDSDETNQFKAAITQFFNSINTDIAYERYDFALGTGKVVFKIFDLPKCLDSALYAVNSSIIYGVNQGYDSNVMDTPEGDLSLLLTPARRQRLIHSIETLNPEALHSTISEILMSNRDYYANHPNIAYRVANSILLVCISVISDHIGPQYYTEKKVAQATASFSRCSNIFVLYRTCMDTVQDVYQIYRRHLEQSNQLPIADAKRYIHRNYQKKSFSLILQNPSA